MNKSIDNAAPVCIPIPSPFLDSDGRKWTLDVRNGKSITLGLPDVLLLTLRKAPVRSGLDAMRVYDIREAIKACSGQPSVTLPESDFIWMVEHFGEVAHTVWLAPEAAFLIKYLILNKTTKNVTPVTDVNAMTHDV